jgi:hypothetical protein
MKREELERVSDFISLIMTIEPEGDKQFLWRSSGFKNGVLKAGETILEGVPMLLFEVVVVGVEQLLFIFFSWFD